jgi:hypothetical protein
MVEKISKSKIHEWTFFCSSLLLFFFILGLGNALSQSASSQEPGPQIRLGDVTFKVREVPSTPSALRMLEIYIEVLNRGQKPVPANTIKVALTTREVKFSSENPGEPFAPPVEETALSVPLLPRSGRLQMFGIEIPKGKPESITFEVQLNPPDGEKKTVSFNF